MTNDFGRLLEATSRTLTSLQEQGVRHLPVSPETLAALRRPARSTQPAAPTPASAPTPAVAPKTKRPSAPREAVAPAARPTVRTDADAKAGAGDRRTRLDQLRERVLPCRKCPHLVSSRTQVVFGVGNPEAELMFVGEAPGADEDAQGEPFVGRAGQLLTRMIETMGLSRDTVFIANILKCRPDTPGKSSGNRKPTPDEMKVCLPYLLEQIEIIQPKVLVALGATAVEGLLGKTVGITRLRGNWRTFQDLPVMPTYHPAYLLRNQSITERRKVWEDMLQVLERLGHPISDKQRSYFTKA